MDQGHIVGKRKGLNPTHAVWNSSLWPQPLGWADLKHVIGARAESLIHKSLRVAASNTVPLPKIYLQDQDYVISIEHKQGCFASG